MEFLSQSLFRASLTLAPNVPVGTHKARAFLFRNGVFIKENSAQLAIVKSGFERSCRALSVNHGIFYGMSPWPGHADRLARPHHLPQGLSGVNKAERKVSPAAACRRQSRKMRLAPIM